MKTQKIIDLISTKIDANKEKAERVKIPQTVNIPSIYAQAYEYLLLDIKDLIDKTGE